LYTIAEERAQQRQRVDETNILFTQLEAVHEPLAVISNLRTPLSLPLLHTLFSLPLSSLMIDMLLTALLCSFFFEFPISQLLMYLDIQNKTNIMITPDCVGIFP